MTNTELIAQALEYAEWADANIYEVPITLPDVLREMANMIQKQEQELKAYSKYDYFLASHGCFPWNDSKYDCFLDPHSHFPWNE